MVFICPHRTGQTCLEPEVFFFGSGCQPVDLGTQVVLSPPETGDHLKAEPPNFAP